MKILFKWSPMIVVNIIQWMYSIYTSPVHVVRSKIIARAVPLEVRVYIVLVFKENVE